MVPTTDGKDLKISASGLLVFDCTKNMKLSGSATMVSLLGVDKTGGSSNGLKMPAILIPGVSRSIANPMDFSPSIPSNICPGRDGITRKLSKKPLDGANVGNLHMIVVLYSTFCF